MDKQLTEQDFINFTKDLFSGPRESKPQMMLGLDFIKDIRKRDGDDGLYAFISNVIVLCGEDTYDYLIKFHKEYKPVFIQKRY